MDFHIVIRNSWLLVQPSDVQKLQKSLQPLIDMILADPGDVSCQPRGKPKKRWILLAAAVSSYQGRNQLD